MAVYELCLPQRVYRKLFERCERARVSEQTMEWVFGRRTLAFLGPMQYKSLEYGETESLKADKSFVSPAHEFGSYNLGIRGRLKRRRQIFDKLDDYDLGDLNELLPQSEVGPWLDSDGRHYKFEEAYGINGYERWSVRLPYQRREGSQEKVVEMPDIGKSISLKRGEEILTCRIIDVGKQRTATALIIFEYLE